MVAGTQGGHDAAPRKSLAEVIDALRQATWALVLPFIIVFGLKFGVFHLAEPLLGHLGVGPGIGTMAGLLIMFETHANKLSAGCARNGDR